jgi:hypothetical protein
MPQTRDKMTEKILDNHLNRIRIVGLYGFKDDDFIDPSDPECELIVVFKNVANTYIYLIEKDKFLIMFLSKDLNHGYKFADLDKTFLINKDELRIQIKKYLESDNIIVSKDEIYGWLCRF